MPEALTNEEVELRLSRHFYDLAALAPQDAEACLASVWVLGILIFGCI